jgi:hypothetical protein
VLHYLAALLVQAGQAVATTSLCYFNPTIPVRPFAVDTDIDILCDTISPNETGAKRKCRWMLCYADKYFKGRITSDECAIVYQPEYLESVKKVCDYPLSNEDVVYIPHIDPAWCFPGNKTIKNCLYGIEVANKQDISVNPCLPPGVVTIPHRDDIFPDGDYYESFYNHQRTLGILRASENFYTVDHNTAMSIEAQLCGCQVWYVQKDGTSRRMEFTTSQLQHELMQPERDVLRAGVFAKKVKRFFQKPLTFPAACDSLSV